MLTSTAKPAAIGATCLIAALGAALFVPVSASAHGFVDGDSLVARVAHTGNTGLGDAAYNRQGLEAPKGFPAAGPIDGELASAGQSYASTLDEQSEDRWVKNDVTTGDVDVDWTFTAAHKTTQWRYFMTTPTWDPNDELSRDDLELITTVEHDGTEASNDPDHTITIPEDREGYHVIYAVWDVADTPNAFYNVIDVDVEKTDAPGEPDTEAPSYTSDIRAHATGATTASVSWPAATDNVEVTSYAVFTGTGSPATVVDGSATSTLLTGLSPDTEHAVTVHARDRAGNVGGSAIVPLHTAALPDEPDTEAPTKPSGLHTMSLTDTTVDLMWTRATDDVGVVLYKVWDRTEDEFVATSTDTSVTVTGLQPNSRQSLTVHALDAAGNISPASNIVTFTTLEEDTTPAPSTWIATAAYTKGDIVTHDGDRYEAVQSHQGNGDPSWITALSLWTKK